MAIRKLLTDTIFIKSMNEKEKEVCVLFKHAVRKFWENTKDPD